jgi:hypothetical protein
MFSCLIALALSRSALPDKPFLAHMRAHNVLYVGREYHLRLGIFQANLRYIREFNRRSAFSLSANGLACLTPSEYRALLGARPRAARAAPPPPRAGDPPPAVDWRAAGAVPPVRDQGSCGSDWAFAAISAQESRWNISGEPFVNLSEQNLVDCITKECYGCNGGWPQMALEWVRDNQGGKFARQDDYPYAGRQMLCAFDECDPVSAVVGVARLPAGDEGALEGAVADGPVAAVVDAGLASFQLYSSGIYNDAGCSSVAVNHAVAVVGYGADGGTDFWIVRNSWGTNWGEAGYIRISRNDGNKCGIATDVVYPLVK